MSHNYTDILVTDIPKVTSVPIDVEHSRRNYEGTRIIVEYDGDMPADLVALGVTGRNAEDAFDFYSTDPDWQDPDAP